MQIVGKYEKRHKKMMIAIIFLKILNAALLVGIAFFTGLLMQSSHTGEVFGIDFNLFNVIMILSTYALLLLISYLSSEYVLQKFILEIKFSLESRLIRSISQRYYESSEIVNMLNSDIKIICEKFYKNKVLITKNITFIVCVLLFSFLYDYQSFLVTVCFITLAFCIQFFLVKKIPTTRLQLQDMKIDYNREIQSFVGARMAIKSFEGSDYIKRRLGNVIKQKAEKERQLNVKILLTNGLVGVIPPISTIFCGIFYAFILINHSRDLSGAVTMIFITGYTLWEVYNMFYAKTQVDSAKEVIKKFDCIIAEAKIQISTVADNLIQIADSDEIFEFKNVSVYFNNNNPVISNLNIKLFKSKKYLVLGNSGSGKSTFLKLLLKEIEEYDGDIFYNQTNLKEIYKEQLFKSVAYLPQKPEFLPENVALNIAFAENYDKDKIEYALKCAESSEIASQYEKIISEENSNFSGGELQKIAFSRVFYHKEVKDIVLLDEFSSAIDKDTRGKLLEALTILEGKTIFVVSHNVSSEYLSLFDEVIIFEAGKIIFCGSDTNDKKVTDFISVIGE